MINTKAALVSGAVAAVALMLLSKGAADGGGGVVEQIKARAGGIVGSEGGATPQNVYNIPGETFTGFPEQQDYTSLIDKFFQTQETEETPDVNRERKAIQAAHKKVVSKGFDPSTTFTGTETTPAFVQRDIYHKAMLAELGLATKKIPSPAEQRAEVSYQKTVAIAYGRSGGGGGSTSTPKKAVSTPKKRKPTTYRATAGGGQVAI